MDVVFQNNLVVENVTDRWWRVHVPLVVQINGVKIEVPRGFGTDFASVPRLPITFSLFGDIGHRSAVLHDYLYSETGPTISRRDADEIFRDALIVEGVSKWKAWMMYWGVRMGGRSHFKEW